MRFGLDVGTWRTAAVGVAPDGRLHLPQTSVSGRVELHSIRSWACLDPLIVGQELSPEDLRPSLIANLVTSPKLELRTADTERAALLEKAIRALAHQVIGDHLFPTIDGEEVVASVPPGWDLRQCRLMARALAETATRHRFFHEPVAVLVALRWIAQQLGQHGDVGPVLPFLGSLRKRPVVLVIDWGAGTIDLAVVETKPLSDGVLYQCLFDCTIEGHGGARMAEDVAFELARRGSPVSELDASVHAVLLQSAWEDPGRDYAGLLERDDLAQATRLRRSEASAVVVEKVTEAMLALQLRAGDVSIVQFGGPLESAECRHLLEGQLRRSCGFNGEQFFSASSEFLEECRRSTNGVVNVSRDAVVAIGACVFGELGRAEPEFDYLITPRDGQNRDSAPLVVSRRNGQRGTKVVCPEYTGVDYSVRVSQQRNGQDTALADELSLYVRPGAVVRYELSASVGAAHLRCSEAQKMPVPEPFSDSIVVEVAIPERSTRFTIANRNGVRLSGD